MKRPGSNLTQGRGATHPLGRDRGSSADDGATGGDAGDSASKLEQYAGQSAEILKFLVGDGVGVRAEIIDYGLLLARILLRSNSIGAAFRARHLFPSDEKRVETTIRDIPRVPARDFTPSMLAQITRFKTPVVFEGLAGDSAAVAQWSRDFFRTNFGDVNVPLQHSVGVCTVREIMDLIDRGEPDQINNVADILADHPVLLDSLPIKEVARSLEQRFLGANLFVAGGQRGSGYHCANEFNLFFQVRGVKEWFLVHPVHSPRFDHVFDLKGGIYCASTLPWGEHPKNTPIGRARLEPGDVLVNLPWWWHWVLNGGDTTDDVIGVATRWGAWRNRFAATDNPVFSALQWSFPHQWKLLWDHYVRGRTFTDETWINAFDYRSRKSQ